MGNADDAVRRRATHVTGSNDEDGLAYAIERFMLDAPSRVTRSRVARAARPALLASLATPGATTALGGEDVIDLPRRTAMAPQAGP